MNGTPALASAPRRPAPLAALEAIFRSLPVLRDRMSARRRAMRFRWELKRMMKDNPHLIDDIGLTRRQAEAEIARLPVWQR